ncbi:NPP1 family protein [Streptomyces sp. NPDC001822]|uniref:NPP1 family protein n=1 Tax=Streptomyces sp. NPDC001822 TaxID=3364614 RepID=UPI0036933FAA
MRQESLRRQEFLRRGWHIAGAALVAGAAGLLSAFAAVQMALRVVIAHSGTYFDVLVAKHLATDLSGTVAGLVAGSGVPVGWRMAPFSGHITAPWVFEHRSELLLVGMGPLLGTAVLGWFVAAAARALALPKWQLLTASAASYAFLAGLAQVATREPGATAAMELSTSTVWAVVAAAGWALAVGGVIVRFYPGAERRSYRSVRAARQRAVRGTAVTIAVAVVASLVSAGTAAADSPYPQGPPQKWRASGVPDALKDLEREAGHELDVANNPQTGTPSTLGGLRSPLAGRGVPAWLHTHAKLFGVTDTDGMLSKGTGRVEQPDPTGGHHVWYDQSIDGVRVYNARLGVHLDRDNKTVTAVTNGLRPDLIPPASTVPTVRSKDAVTVAGKTMQHARTTASPSLVVYPGSPAKGFKSPSALAWQIDVMDKSGFSERVFVDALRKGVIVGVQPLTETAEAAAAEPPRALPQNATANDLKWAPDVDYDTDGCYNVPAIGPDGTIAQGLEHNNTTTSSDCRDQSDLDNTNAYSRQRCNMGWCVYLYDYYFEKDVAVENVADVGHTHDWEHVAVWVKDDRAEYVSTSAHGGYHVHLASDVLWDGTHPKVVYQKDGAQTHNFRLANAGDEPPENHYHNWRRPALVSYNGFPSGLRDKLFNHNFGKATIAIKDPQFPENLIAAIPRHYECEGLPDTGQNCRNVENFPFLYIADQDSPGVPPNHPENLYRAVFDMKHGTNSSGAARVRDEGGPATGDADTDDAYNQSGVVYNYFREKFGRNSIDGNGGELHSYVHYDTNYVNAFWNGSYMTYGDGMLSQDVSGHEMAHGVTQFTAGLQYAFQSGALNESISDFFGEMTERAAKGSNDWLMGSDMKVHAPFRSMADPTVYGQPRHMSAYTQTCFDQGGVHTNSGIPNYAFYRMSALMDPDTTANILWRAMTQYLAPTSTFADAGTAMATAASDLYGPASRQASVTSTVWENEVGITANTPDERPAGCNVGGGLVIHCSTLEQVYSNSGALSSDGASLEDVAGSLIHMYELGAVSDSPSVNYYEKLFLDNRDDVNSTLNLDGPLMEQFVRTIQAWSPVLKAVGTDKADTVIMTQSQLDAADSLIEGIGAAADEQGTASLAKVVSKEWGRIDVQHLVGLSAAQGVAYLDTVVEQIPTPTPAQSLASTFDNVSVTQDTSTGAGNFDGGGASFSAKALATVGVTPGSAVSHSGVVLNWPSSAGTGKPDNTVAHGQTIAVQGTGNSLGFLVSASHGPAGGKGSILYSDKTSQPFSLSSPDWSGGDGDVAVSSAYRNRQGNQTYNGSAYVYYAGVPLQSGKTPVSVTLPDASAATAPDTPALHVYAMGLGKAAPGLASVFNNIAVTQDTATDLGDLDGGGASFSAKALATAGAKPGSTVTHSGIGFTWPSSAGVTGTDGTRTFGKPDNAIASGQTVAVNGTRGSTLGFLVSASYGPAGGVGTVSYSDGTSQPFSLSSADWFGGDGDVAVSSAYQNRQGNQTYNGSAYVYYVGVPLQSGKTPVSVKLPTVSYTALPDTPTLHVFAMTRG